MANPYQQYNQNPWAAQQQPMAQPGFFVPQASDLNLSCGAQERFLF